MQKEDLGLFSFFKNLLRTKDTSRASNLTEDELGFEKTPVRTNQRIALFCEAIGNSEVSGYFFDKSQVTTNTALSRKGFLPRLVVTTTKKTELSSKTPSHQANKGWFSKKKQPQEEEV